MLCRSNTDKTEWLLLLMVAFSAVAVEGQLLQIALHIVLPVVFLLVGYKRLGGLLPNKSMKLYLALIIWLALASLTAHDTGVALREMVRISSAFLCSFSLYHIASRKSNDLWIYIIMILSFASMMYYASNNIGLAIAHEVYERLEDDVVNANMFAYSLFYATFACFFIAMFYIKRVTILKAVLFLALLALSVWVSLMTASRQVLVLQIPLLICLFSIGTLKFNAKNVLLLVLCGVTLIFLFPVFETYFSGSLLADRSTTAFGEDVRFTMLGEAIRVGLGNPILGVGPGNFVLVNKWHIFSHNNFAEILACGGIPAFVMYVAIVWHNLKDQWKRYKSTKDVFFLYHACFQLFFIFDNFFYVQIGSLWLMAFYFVSVGHSDLYFKENYNTSIIGQ